MEKDSDRNGSIEMKKILNENENVVENQFSKNSKLDINKDDDNQIKLGIKKDDEYLDIIGIATICFNKWIENKPGKVDVNNILILLDAIGIKKNEYELKNLIEILRKNPSINFNLQDDDKYDLNDFKEIVKAIREERSYIEEKFMVEAFSRIDEKNQGVIDKDSLKKYARKAVPNITDEEIMDIIKYFNSEDEVMTYENFFKLYHEG